MLHMLQAAPLSPPTSPRMSDTPAKAADYHSSTKYHDPHATHVPTAGDEQTLEPTDRLDPHFDDQARPSLRSYKTFPYSLGPSNRLPHNASLDVTGAPESSEYSERLMNQGPQPEGTSNLPPATYGGSAPTSPAGRVTPRSGGYARDEERLEDEEMALGGVEVEHEGEGEEKRKLTPAEITANKRRMKRFRLTHNQTRFLMSEFARNANPDAPQREKLAREIPGLSSRQVQVWFQNRRAKLKRLTTDDRDRMMRSRALPENFDMTHALHSPFGSAAPPMGVPTPSSSGYSQSGQESSGIGPLTLDTLRRVPDYDNFATRYASQAGEHHVMGHYGYTPPQSATETVSPSSAMSDMSAFGISSRQSQESPRRPPYSYGMLQGSTGYGSHAQSMHRLQTHDRFGRPLGEAVSSPLRTSMSYAGIDSVAHNQGVGRASSFSETSLMRDRYQHPRSLTNPSPTNYGFNFTYGQLPAYQSAEQQQQLQQSPGSTGTPVVGLHSYRRDSDNQSEMQPRTSYPQYQSSLYSSTQVPQYGGYTSMYPAASSYQTYQQSQAQHTSPHERPQSTYAPMHSQLHHYPSLTESTEEAAQEEGDNSDGGAPVPTTY